jgi:hypothetical protein
MFGGKKRLLEDIHFAPHTGQLMLCFIVTNLGPVCMVSEAHVKQRMLMVRIRCRRIKEGGGGNLRE